MQKDLEVYPPEFQGTPEWIELRKKKVTATDAPVIMNSSPFKDKKQLFYEKIGELPPTIKNERMLRGIELEPKARELFVSQIGIWVEPKVFVKDWQMASLDGIDETGKYVLEIKCPGKTDHIKAVNGFIPPYYYPQLQHQMSVVGVQKMFYLSFDGEDGVILEVFRDDQYIEKMIVEEKKFYDLLTSKTPPNDEDEFYVDREDDIWKSCTEKWKSVNGRIKDLEKEEQDLRDQLFILSQDRNSKGNGVSVCHTLRRGNVDYSKVPQLKGLNLDFYRKPPIKTCRIFSSR